MPRRSQPNDPEALRQRMQALIDDFEGQLEHGDLRQKVVALVPAFHTLRDLGSSLLDAEGSGSARDRILEYLLAYPHTPIDGDELMVVSGIGEWARRVRELRVQAGWRIISGVTFDEMLGEDVFAELPLPWVARLASDQYMLVDTRQDREAAHRWHVANGIRKSTGSVHSKLLRFLRENVGSEVTGEELRYVAGDKSEWARRIRELRTEFGWPVLTRVTGRPDLPVGVYVLEADRQAPEHDRQIPDAIRGQVFRRDGYECRHCSWNHEMWNRSDPRHLEAHHVVQHKDGGGNTADNLITLCTVCHDEAHSH